MRPIDQSSEDGPDNTGLSTRYSWQICRGKLPRGSIDVILQGTSSHHGQEEWIAESD
jgi:hypothetical protein